MNNCSTNIKGVFAGGDAVNGGKEVVDAVEDGKHGAKAIIKYLDLLRSEPSYFKTENEKVCVIDRYLDLRLNFFLHKTIIHLVLIATPKD